MKTETIILALVLFLTAAIIPAFAGNAVTYTYDALGRLIKLTFDNGTTQTYTYDAAGNRITDATPLPAPVVGASGPCHIG